LNFQHLVICCHLCHHFCAPGNLAIWKGSKGLKWYGSWHVEWHHLDWMLSVLEKRKENNCSSIINLKKKTWCDTCNLLMKTQKHIYVYCMIHLKVRKKPSFQTRKKCLNTNLTFCWIFVVCWHKYMHICHIDCLLRKDLSPFKSYFLSKYLNPPSFFQIHLVSMS
jgi:hypothetical protein